MGDNTVRASVPYQYAHVLDTITEAELSRRCLTSPSICTSLVILLAVRQSNGLNEKTGLAIYIHDKEAFRELLIGMISYMPTDCTMDVRIMADDDNIPRGDHWSPSRTGSPLR